MDGHRALENKEVNRADARDFQLVLSALSESESSFTFIIHASSNTWSLSGMGPLDLLARLGYQHFQGNCPFHRDRCMWRPLASVARAPFADVFDVQRIHEAFKAHATKLPEIYQKFREIADEFSIGPGDEIDLFPELRQFRPPRFEPRPDAIPEWAASEVPARFFDIRTELDALSEEARKLHSIVSMLWETGDPLADGVCDMFQELGYTANHTPKGHTYDVTINLDETRRLLIEATGIDGSLKKDSNKIAQALQTLQQDAGDGDRVVVAVNAYRKHSLEDREGLESVTDNALTLLQGLKANVVTTLYGIWKLSLTDVAGAKARIDALYAHDGGHFVG